MIENENFWYDEEQNEVHLKSKGITICAGSNQTVIIEKLYAPLDFCNVRITPVSATCTWKLEREHIIQDEDGNDICVWETVFEFDAQE